MSTLETKSAVFEGIYDVPEAARILWPPRSHLFSTLFQQESSSAGYGWAWLIPS